MDIRQQTHHHLLVVTAHPDDESFPIGGTIARYATQGVDVTLLCATRGEKGIPNLSAAATAALREQELRKAAAELAVSDVRFLDLIDGEVMQADTDYVVGQLVTTLQQIRPDVVITFGPDGISGHPDHIAISHYTTQAFKLALEKSALPPTARLYYITPSEATAQGCGVPPSSSLAGGPVAAIDVSSFLVAKVRAAQQHVSQHPPFMGEPEVEAAQLACHEYFTLVHPRGLAGDILLEDLFAPLRASY